MKLKVNNYYKDMNTEVMTLNNDIAILQKDYEVR